MCVLQPRKTTRTDCHCGRVRCALCTRRNTRISSKTAYPERQGADGGTRRRRAHGSTRAPRQKTSPNRQTSRVGRSPGPTRDCRRRCRHHTRSAWPDTSRPPFGGGKPPADAGTKTNSQHGVRPPQTVKAAGAAAAAGAVAAGGGDSGGARGAGGGGGAAAAAAAAAAVLLPLLSHLISGSRPTQCSARGPIPHTLRRPNGRALRPDTLTTPTIRTPHPAPVFPSRQHAPRVTSTATAARTGRSGARRSPPWPHARTL